MCPSLRKSATAHHQRSGVIRRGYGTTSGPWHVLMASPSRPHRQGYIFKGTSSLSAGIHTSHTSAQRTLSVHTDYNRPIKEGDFKKYHFVQGYFAKRHICGPEHFAHLNAHIAVVAPQLQLPNAGMHRLATTFVFERRVKHSQPI